MSNTSRVSPYDSSSTTVGVASVVGSAVGSGLASLIGWLCEETAEDRAVTARCREERRHERLSGMRAGRSAPAACLKPMSVTTIPLKLKTPESLVRTAERLGYRIEPLTGHLAPLSERGTVLLQHTDGRRLAIAPAGQGRVQLAFTGDRTPAVRLVGQHSNDRATAFLAKEAMQVQRVTLANGETQILARDLGSKPDGRAEVKVQVRANGTLDVDVDCVLGRRCERIVNGLAAAIGGEATAVAKKASYYEEPGEPTKTRVKV